MAKKRVVLAYSGGLDTSVAIKWLMEKGYEVVCFMADIGQGEDNKKARERALKIGAKKCVVKDLKKKFVAEYVFPTLKSGALYEGKYNLATALSRPLIADSMIGFAKEEKANALSHGCTGKGNDQVRFEVTFKLKAPELEIIAPVREWGLKTREAEIDYATKHNLPIEQTKKKSYSIDFNLWGVSVEGGALEDAWTSPPENTYISIKSLEKALDKRKELTIHFEEGVPVGIDKKGYNAVDLVQELNKIGAFHGIGRVDVIEDRLVGIKSREVYEAPASTILYAAHTALEELVLDREVRKTKSFLAERYAELVYYGLWFTPLKDAIDAFVNKTQTDVSGDVRMGLYKGNAVVCGRRSPNSRYKVKLATYGKGDVFDQSLAKGFIDLWAMPYR